jgi:hypothetical protein
LTLNIIAANQTNRCQTEQFQKTRCFQMSLQKQLSSRWDNDSDCFIQLKGGCARIWGIVGNGKAKVLPLPVSAQPMILRRERIHGIAWHWIAVRNVNFNWSRKERIAATAPHCDNFPIGVGILSPWTVIFQSLAQRSSISSCARFDDSLDSM